MGLASTLAKNLIGCILNAREMQLGQKKWLVMFLISILSDKAVFIGFV